MPDIKNCILLVVGVAACAASVILIKGSGCHPVALAGWRLCLAAALLTPIMLCARRGDPRPLSRLINRSAPGAVLLALHFITWAWGATHTSAANATLIVNLVPVLGKLGGEVGQGTRNAGTRRQRDVEWWLQQQLLLLLLLQHGGWRRFLLL